PVRPTGMPATGDESFLNHRDPEKAEGRRQKAEGRGQKAAKGSTPSCQPLFGNRGATWRFCLLLSAFYLLCVSVVSSPAKQDPEAEPNQDGHGTGRFFGIDLGGAGLAVFKNDGCLADPAAGPETAEQHFLLEGIASGEQMVQVGLAQLGDPVTTVAAAAIMGWQAHEQPHHRIDSPAQQTSR